MNFYLHYPPGCDYHLDLKILTVLLEGGILPSHSKIIIFYLLRMFELGIITIYYFIKLLIAIYSSKCVLFHKDGGSNVGFTHFVSQFYIFVPLHHGDGQTSVPECRGPGPPA